MSKYFDLIDHFESSELFLQKIAITIIAVIIIFALNKLIRYILKNTLENQKIANVIVRTIGYLSILFGIFFVSWIWFDRSRGPAIVFVVLLALVALSMKGLIQNIAAWFYIMSHDLYDIGDRIEVDDIIGDVVNIGIFHTYLSEVKGNLLTIESATGRYVSIPNSYIYNKPIYNYCHDYKYIWTETSLTVPYDANINEAMRVAGTVAYELYENMIKKYDDKELKVFKQESKVVDEELKPRIRREFGNHGINIYIMFFTRYNEIAAIRNYYQFELWEAFKQKNIPVTFASSLIVEEK